MSRQLSLFAPVEAAQPADDVNVVARRLPHGLYLGTSSWSFPGWEGIVYDRKVSKSALARHGLAAYAKHPLFKTVGIDRTYYGPISKVEFAHYADAVPEHFRFVIKAHEMLTRIRTKDDVASLNPAFLDVNYAMEEVIGPCLEGLGKRASVLLLQFPPQQVDSTASRKSCTTFSVIFQEIFFTQSSFGTRSYSAKANPSHRRGGRVSLFQRPSKDVVSRRASAPRRRDIYARRGRTMDAATKSKLRRCQRRVLPVQQAGRTGRRVTKSDRDALP